MRNRKYLIGVLVGVVGVLAFPSLASATAVSQSLQTTLAPAKQDPKKFGGVSLHNIIGTQVDDFALTQSPRQTTFTIDPNVKFVNGNIPACPLASIQGRPNAVAKSQCGRSITGQGTVEANGGAIQGQVLLISGGPRTIYVHTDLANGALILVITGAIAKRTLTFTGIPNTPGNVLTLFDTVFNKRKTSTKKQDKKGKKTFYVMARCKAKRWSTTETTQFYGGEVLTASSSQKCKKTGGKKK